MELRNRTLATWNKYFYSIIGPVITALILFANFLLYPVSLAPSFVVLVWATYLTQGRVGASVAGIISGFNFYYRWQTEPIRVVVVLVCALVLAWLVARLKRRTIQAEHDRYQAILQYQVETIRANAMELEAKELAIQALENQEKVNFVDNLDGHVRLVKSTRSKAVELQSKFNSLFAVWAQWDSAQTLEVVKIISSGVDDLAHDLTNLQQAVAGWRDMARLRRIFIQKRGIEEGLFEDDESSTT